MPRLPRSLLTAVRARAKVGGPDGVPQPERLLWLVDRLAVANPAVLRAARERYPSDDESALAHALDLWWRAVARPGQRVPRGTWWRIAYLMAARGAGKTFAGAQWLADQVEQFPGREWGIVAPTSPTAKDTCVDGPSGIRRILEARGLLVDWLSSVGKVVVPNGGVIYTDGADDGAPTMQGKNLAGCWADEVGVFKQTQWRRAWLEAIQPAVRISPAPGRRAQILATGTPKRGHPLVKWLLAHADLVKHMTTAENEANLSPDFVAELRSAFAGTSLERQELLGQYVEQAAGALWSVEQIERCRVAAAPAELKRIVAALDPAVTNTDTSDETGLIAMGLGADGHGYVLGDWSGKYSPDGAMRKAVTVYHLLKADRLIIEANNGGDYLPAVLKSVDPNVPCTKVNASRGKRTRAEPIAALAEQGKIHHVGTFPHLEDELTGWDGSGASPNRLDAYVWAATALLLQNKTPHVYVLD